MKTLVNITLALLYAVIPDSGMFGVEKGAVLYFAQNGINLYGTKNLLIAFAVVAVLAAAWYFLLPLLKLRKRLPWKERKVWQKVRVILAWVLICLLAVVAALGYCGWQTISNTTGVGKPGNNDKFNPDTLTTKADSPLQGKTILFLGSSVTQGYAAKNISFVDYIEKLDGANVIKEVMGATTVANANVGYGVAENSYNPRLRKYDRSTPVDAVVIQLSSNDSTAGMPLGEISDSFDIDDIDDTTFAGGMESLIAYARQEWDCPIIIYSNPEFRVKSWYNAQAYKAMVDKCQEVVDKWGVDYLNMWDDPAVKAVSLKDYNFWMSDVVHPTKAGYLQWWTPMFEEHLYSLLAE